MKKNSEREEILGDIRIRSDVVHAIVSTTLKEIDGIADMGQTFTPLEKISSLKAELKERKKLSKRGLKFLPDFLTGFTEGVKQIISKKTLYKGIKVDIIDNQKTDVKILIIAEYGENIPQLARKIQEKVKESIESLTGLSARKINVEIQGLACKIKKQNN